MARTASGAQVSEPPVEIIRSGVDGGGRESVTETLIEGGQYVVPAKRQTTTNNNWDMLPSPSGEMRKAFPSSHGRERRGGFPAVATRVDIPP